MRRHPDSLKPHELAALYRQREAAKRDPKLALKLLKASVAIDRFKASPTTLAHANYY